MKRVITLATSRTSVVLKDWLDAHCRVKPRHWLRFALGLTLSVLFAPCRIVERILYARRIRRTRVPAPVFVLGHWRTGTTLLQYMLGQDPSMRFVTPLASYSVNSALIKAIMRKPLEQEVAKGRDMDNMKWGIDKPYEEYITFTLCSPYSSWTHNLYPQDRVRYLDYAFVDELPPRLQAKWQRRYDYMLRKFATAFPEGSHFLLKSPDVNARAKYLSQVYPDACFVNIYRNPYAVIRSTIHMMRIVYGYFALQDVPTDEELEDFVFYQFKRIYTKYFEDLESIDPARIVELRFEDFEQDPMPLLRDVYARFGWDWQAAEAPIRAYWDSLEGYEKNVFDYTPHLIARVNDELGFYLEHYGYTPLEVPDQTYRG